MHNQTYIPYSSESGGFQGDLKAIFSNVKATDPTGIVLVCLEFYNTSRHSVDGH